VNKWVKVLAASSAMAVFAGIAVWLYFFKASADAQFSGYTTLVGSLVGALAGASGAYAIQHSLAKKSKRDADRLAANKILFYLLQQINTVALIYKDYFHEHRRHPLRFILVMPTQPYDIERFVFDVNTWSFMLETTESRKIMYELHMAQEQYIEAIRHWNYRSAFHDREVQPILSDIFPDRYYASVSRLRQVLGQRVFIAIVTATDEAENALKRAFMKLTKSNDQFRKYVVERFKSEDFTKFDFPETWGLQEPEQPSPTLRGASASRSFVDQNVHAYRYGTFRVRLRL
jgi:hypothetical protein